MEDTMNNLALAFALVGLLYAPATSLAGPSDDTCSRHSDCSDLEVCNGDECESAVGRTYIVTVIKAQISEKRTTAPAKGKTWDTFGGLPDPRVEVYFPDINTKAFSVKGIKDTTSPKWNASQKITVTAVGQEIWFCLYDQDASSHDALKTTKTGKSNCIGHRNIIDFIRKGSFKTKTDGDVKSFKATIKRKGGGGGSSKSGKKLWRKACDHAFDVARSEARSEGDREEPSKAELRAAMRSCVLGFENLPRSNADTAAKCMRRAKSMTKIGTCMERD
jgi:hypothetical protein